MTTKEKIIKRLNRAFGFNFTNDNPSYHHGGRGYWSGCWSWGISNDDIDVGSMSPMSECLRWKKWVYSSRWGEIFEYVEGQTHLDPGDLIENLEITE